MPKIMIPVDQLFEHGLPDEESDEVEVYEDVLIDTTRWSNCYRIVFKWLDGKVYSAEYSRGATEMQHESPWEYQKEVECTEVQQVEKIVKVWEAV